MGNLTAKQARFVEEYLIDLNATQAAIRAGYSERTANEQASRLLANAKVSAAVARAQAERSDRTGVTLDYVLSRLAVEAEREGEGASHAARVSALKVLREHIVDTSGGGSNQVADALREIAGKLPG